MQYIKFLYRFQQMIVHWFFFLIFDDRRSIETGLKSLTFMEFPDLYKGITLASFVASGKTPRVKEILQVCKRGSYTGLILGLRPANERCRYKVMPSLIAWAQT